VRLLNGVHDLSIVLSHLRLGRDHLAVDRERDGRSVTNIRFLLDIECQHPPRDRAGRYQCWEAPEAQLFRGEEPMLTINDEVALSVFPFDNHQGGEEPDASD
jgi:hypothetical protein